MNTLVIVLIAAVCLFAGYTLYGRWLANKWGIDPKAKTPAVAMEDGQDYVPTDGWNFFEHQLSSRQQHLAGFQFCYGSSSVVSSSALLQTLVLCMPVLRTKESPWDF